MTYRQSLIEDTNANHRDGHLSDAEAKTLHGIIGTVDSVMEFRAATVLKRVVIGWSHPNKPVCANVVAPRHCPVVSVYPVDTPSTAQ